MIQHNYRRLQIWTRSMDLTESIYKIVAKFPAEEKYGLVSQLKRSAISVPSNIAEGSGRGTPAQFKLFLEYAMGSCNELQTQIELASRFGYINNDEYDTLSKESVELFKMILGFYNSLN